MNRKVTVGLTLSCLFLLCFVNVFLFYDFNVQASALFSDGFESGDFSVWDGTDADITVTNETVHSGTYCAKIASTSYVGWVYFDVVSSTVYVDQWLKISALPSAWDSVIVGSEVFNDIYYARLAALRIYNNGGTLTWDLEYYTNAAGENHAYNATPSISTDTWYRCKYVFKAGNGDGEASLWVNGDKIIENTGLTNDDYQSTRVYAGYYDSWGDGGLNVYVDDVIIADTDILYNVAPTNDACDSDANFNVGSDGWVNMTVSDTNLVADLSTVSILVSTQDAKSFRLNWTQATGVFSEEADASGICTLSGNSTRVNVDSDTDKIAFCFAVSAEVQYGNVNVTAQTIDDAGASDTDSYVNEFSINAYSSFVVLDGNSTHTWNVTVNTNDNLINEGAIYFKVTTNFAFDIQAKSDREYLNTTNNDLIGVGNVTIHHDTVGSSLPLTTSYVDVGGLTAQSMGVDVELSVKVWLDVPSGTPFGDYQYVLSIQVIEA